MIYETLIVQIKVKRNHSICVLFMYYHLFISNHQLKQKKKKKLRFEQTFVAFQTLSTSNFKDHFEMSFVSLLLAFGSLALASAASLPSQPRATPDPWWIPVDPRSFPPTLASDRVQVVYAMAPLLEVRSSFERVEELLLVELHTSPKKGICVFFLFFVFCFLFLILSFLLFCFFLCCIKY